MAIERRKNRGGAQASASTDAADQRRPLIERGEAVQLSNLSHNKKAAAPKAGAAVAPGSAVPPPRKSLAVAYALWLCCGWWGAHLLYLGRDQQAVLYTSTLGGFFGLGWLRDGWHLPSYVAFANGAEGAVGDAGSDSSSVPFARALRQLHSRFPRAPPRHMLTLLSQMLCAALLGELFPAVAEFFQPGPVPLFPSLASKGINGSARAWMLAFATLPQGLHMAALALRALGVSLGAWAAGNGGMVQRAPLRPVLFFTALVQFLSVAFLSGLPSLWGVVARALDEEVSAHQELLWRRTDRSWMAVIVAVLVYHAKRRWSIEALRVIAAEQARAKKAGEAQQSNGSGSAAAATTLVVLPPELAKAPRRRHALVRFSAFLLQVWLLGALSGAWLLNCSLSPGEAPLRVQLREAIELIEPTMDDVRTFAHAQWESVRSQGASQWWSDLLESLELDGLERSYAALGFDDADSVTDAQLRRRWKKLALQFHPDKPGSMATAGMTNEERQEQFVRIQLAYEKIQKARAMERAASQSQHGQARRRRA